MQPIRGLHTIRRLFRPAIEYCFPGTWTPMLLMVGEILQRADPTLKHSAFP